MNSRIIAVVIALVILVGAGGIFLYSHKSPKTNSSSKPTPTKSAQSTSPSSLTDLLLGGKTQTCNFSNKTADGASTQGTVYLEGTKMRGDITNTTKDGKTSIFYMIRDGNTTYVWGSSLPTGIKMTLSAEDLRNNTAQVNQYASAFNSSGKAEYHCSNWSVDLSKFSVPANVKFMDVSSMMPKTTGTTTQTGPGYSCAGITDPTAKAACEASLQH